MSKPKHLDTKSGSAKNYYLKKVYYVCPECNKGRWIRVEATKRPRFNGLCRACSFLVVSGENNPLWKGGKIVGGYRYIKRTGHPLADVNGYVAEHRLVMSELYGIEAVIDNVIHHIDGDRLNNHPDNLRIMALSRHQSMHARKQLQYRDKKGRYTHG